MAVEETCIISFELRKHVSYHSHSHVSNAPSLALNPAIKLTFQQVIWRTMRALISCLLNICIPQLAIYITAPLNHMSPTPNSTGAPRDATVRNAGEILVQTDHKVFSMPYEEDVLVLGICWLSTFNLTNSAQKLRVHYCLRVGNSFFPWLPLSRGQAGISPIMSNRKLAPDATLIIQDDCFPSCHPSYVRLTPGNAATRDLQEKPFHLVTTPVCTARSYRNTIKMILLPSHITCCAGFCVNVLRIKNSML